MELTISQFEFGAQPKVEKFPNPDFLKHMGEDGMRKMVNEHYELLRKSKVKELFPSDNEEFEKAKLRSSDFFIQICGGHPYFDENRGKPLLVRRHAPFKISPEARIVWLTCYKEVLSKLEIPQNLIQSFWDYINIFSAWMVNTPHHNYKE